MGAIAPKSPALNLRVAGPITRAQIRELSTVHNVQSVVPIELYDTLLVPLANTSVQFNFFQQSRGQQGFWNTNLNVASMLNSKQVFVATEIRLSVTQTAPSASYLADLMALTHGPGAFDLKINNVEHAQGPILDLIGGGLFGFGGTQTTPYAASRAGGTGKGYELNPGLIIPTEVQFGLSFYYPPTAAPVVTVATYMRVKLCGQLVRMATS